jgi:hypothetical protein
LQKLYRFSSQKGQIRIRYNYSGSGFYPAKKSERIWIHGTAAQYLAHRSPLDIVMFLLLYFFPRRNHNERAIFCCCKKSKPTLSVYCRESTRILTPSGCRPSASRVSGSLLHSMKVNRQQTTFSLKGQSPLSRFIFVCMI